MRPESTPGQVSAPFSVHQRDAPGAGHLEDCEICWLRWNRFRWNVAASSTLYRDLEEYLGDQFRPYFDSSRALAREWNRVRPATPQAIKSFYATTHSYLYNQVIWHASGNRPPYLAEALPILIAAGSKIVLDYGCGIGQDTMDLRAHGFQVIGCDHESPPVDFLRWRLRRSGLLRPTIRPDQSHLASQADTLWIIDTLDHIQDLRRELAPYLIGFV